LVSPASLGLTLPHEHLYADFRAGAIPDSADPRRLNRPVTVDDVWRLHEHPYAQRDHLLLDDAVTVEAELSAFHAIGGRTVIDQTPAAVGRDLVRLAEASGRTGVQIIAGAGFYLEEFRDPADRELTTEQMTDRILNDFAHSGSPTPGVIGEVGVSPDFTRWEQHSLRAAATAQRELGVPVFVHIPSWERLGRQVVRILLREEGVDPGAVVLCHLDASGTDRSYQRELAETGVTLEFDMIGMPFWLTGEGQCPDPGATADAIAALVDAGHGARILLSHDLWLKSMYRRFGGNGLLYVPLAFPHRLIRAGVESALIDAMMRENVADLFTRAAARI
jgi:phosphotriesterase-related protein